MIRPCARVRLRDSWPFSLSSAPTVGNPCRPLQPESVLLMILPPGRHEPPRCWPIPVRALEGATSYWAGIVANSSGHKSHHGAHGTEWTLVAPNELARLASLQLVATRHLEGTGVDAPDGLSVPEWWCCKSLQEASMNQVSTVGLDLAKHILPSTSCQAHLAKHILPSTSCQAHLAKHILPSTSCQAHLAKHILPST